MDGQVYLRSYLAPFAVILGRPDVTDIYVNKPREIWTPRRSRALWSGKTPSFSMKMFSSVWPVRSRHERLQIVAPPATRGETALAIRTTIDLFVQLNRSRPELKVSRPLRT